MILREYWEIGLPRAIHNFEKNKKKKTKKGISETKSPNHKFFFEFPKHLIDQSIKCFGNSKRFFCSFGDFFSSFFFNFWIALEP